jgi:hypothetical protein
MKRADERNRRKLEPQGTLTREQAMVIAERMIEKYGW